MKEIQILLVEDNKKMLKTSGEYLESQGYRILEATEGHEALHIFYQEKNTIDLVLLNLILPNLSGFEVLKEIRKISDVPVILLAARPSEEDQINGYEQGADAYIVKPYTMRLLNSQIEVILKRAGKLRDYMNYGDIHVDLVGQKIYWKQNYVETTRREYELLLYFIEHSNTVLKRSTILDAVWGYDYVGDIRTVDTLVKQLRRKLTKECNYIKSIYGVGYLFGEKDCEG